MFEVNGLVYANEFKESLKLTDAKVTDFKIVHGALTWMDEEIDCAPEYMYEHSYAYEEMCV